MSDTRFTILGIILIFAGFLILGTLGSQFAGVTVEANEFGDCFEYFEDKPPIQIDCQNVEIEKSLFFGLVIGLIAGGVISLLKGVRGNWDQKVKPEDMVGPGGENTQGSDDKDSDKK